MNLTPPLWIKKLFSSAFKPCRPVRTRTRRLYLECLEDRTLLSVSVTADTTNLLADANTMVINGSGFDPIVANNGVLFNDGAVGTITAATPTSLFIEFSTNPATAGSLTAVVTSDSVSSGAPVQVATVTPDTTSNATNLPANAATLTINGFGFDTTAGNNSVVFNDGAAGTVTAATANTLTVTFDTEPDTAGNLTAVVTTNGASDGSAIQVAVVQPVITSSSANLAANATTLTINGFGFDPTAGNNTVALDDGATGTVTAATTTSLTVTFATAPTAGTLDTIVTTDGVSSGAAVQVATVTPAVTSSTANLGANAAAITINGTGFDTTAGNNSVVFSDGAVGSVTAATANSLTVLFSTAPTAGNLTAVVTSDGIGSGTPVQVATAQPVATSSTTNLAANAATLTINGFGFDTTAAHNSVVLNDGAVGAVTAATATSLTVTLSVDPATAGNLTAVVTTDSVSSGSAIQVATVTPVVTSSTTNLAANAATITINGFGFDTTAGNNSVAFNSGAVGTITTATATTLTVTFSTAPTAGNLTAVVTTDGVSSGAAIQVATVTPVLTSSTASMAANAATLTINGFGFDTTPGNNTVTFSNGGVGTVTAATATSLTVTFSTSPAPAGNLTAVVTTDGVSSGAPVQVAKATPVVTNNTGNLGFNANTITINGFGFDTTPGNNTVVFNDGAVGSVTTATATALTVTFSTKPTAVGNLTAVVTTDTIGSGGAVQVATVSPVVLTNVGLLLTANATTVTIIGAGFDTTPGNNTVVFNDGAAGSVTAATSTTLTVTFSTKPTTANNLFAVVTSDGVSSGAAMQVATVRPGVTSSTANLAANATTLTINGFGFDPIASHNSVVFNDGAVGTVVAATATSLIVTFSTKPVTAGNLTAVITTDAASSGVPVQVAKVTPVVTSSTANLAANGSTITVNGFGFDATAGNNTVVFNDGAVGTVTAATANSLTIAIFTKPRLAGSLTAVVTTDGVSSGAAVQVATVTPVVLANTALLLAANATTVTINGFGFDTTAGNNTVVFNNGAVGTVTSATATLLTVTFAAAPTAGSLTAIVATGGISSGAAIQVATIAPVVTSSTANLAANATTLTINGIGFDPIAANNSVVFNDGAVGAVTAATATSLTVTFSVSPVTAGNLTAVVTSDTVSSGGAVQVATVIPVVTSSTANLATNATTLTINGFGFDTTAGNNTVALNDGAVGTVTAATATSLTVTFFSNPATAGSLTAVVATDGVNSGTAVQVAAVQPVVASSSANLAATTTTFTINGFGFDTTAGNNTVAFNDGAVGAVTAATATSLTVTLSTNPATAGSLTAVVTTDGAISSAPVQVAVVTPVVTSSAANLDFNTNTLTINGFGFDTTAGNNTVVFNDGAVGTVTAATATSLTVTLSTVPAAVGNLTAAVTTDSQSSGAAVPVATVIPIVTSSTVSLDVHATTLTINGFGFDTNASNDSVVLNDGATGSVTAATATSLTVTFFNDPATAGILTGAVTIDGVSSGTPVQVATVTTIVTGSIANLAANATTLTINGFGFDTTPANNSVVFNDGAVGAVTAATANSLTVTFSTNPVTAGNLTAVVTTDGVASGSAIQVATVTPVVTSSTANLAANATTLTINGIDFDTTAGNNSVVFNDGAVGAVTAATATSLTVTFSTQPAAVGNLTAVVTTDAASSGTPVQVATVTPVVTSSTANLAANATTLTINGVDFDTIAGNNTVLFSSGAVGTVTTATSTSLTVTFSTTPTAGNLTAVVTTDGVSSGTPVQVATVTPVVTSSAASLAANATTLTINGVGFDTTAANNSVVFNRGAIGVVTTATATSLTVTLSAAPTAGNLTAVVTTDAVNSGTAVQVATISPVVLVSNVNQALNGTSLAISGFGFDTTAANNSVVFNDGAVGTVTTATGTSLIVTFSTSPTAIGNLTAVVTTDGISSGAAVKVATVVASVTAPTVTSNVAALSASAATLIITGHNFDTTAANNRVVFNDGAVGVVTTATATSLTVTFSTKPATAGSLTAVVFADGVGSGAAVQVAKVTPVVTSSTASQAPNATTLTINGFGFDPTASNNTVVLSGAAVGVVTAATPTSLTVTFSTRPASAGNLTAVVTTNTLASGTAVQVATIIPVVTSNTANLAANAATLTITGFGFDAVATHNTVAFSNSAVGAVTAASTTSLTVTFSVKPTVLGSMTAVVTTDALSSGAAVQVATVTPFVTINTASLAATANLLIITGVDFDPVAAHNTVVFNDGAIGAVTAATATSLTVTFSTKPITAGSLTAVVTTNTVSNASPVQVASVTPVVTSSSANLADNTPTLTINGFGFDTTAAHNTVTFNDGAVGVVTAATATSLTVTFSTRPTTAGTLTAVVTTNSQTSGAAVQVATVTPVVTTSTANLGLTATTVTIAGFGFDPVATHNTVVFNDGAVGTVTTATATSLVVTFSVKPTALGNLTAVVTTDAHSTGTALQVATVVPVVTVNTANLAASASTLTISGAGFDPIAANNTVVFNNGAVGAVTAATATSLTVTFSTQPVTAGSLTVVVTTDSFTAGAAVQVAKVTPVVTSSTASQVINATTLTIAGFGFDPIAAHNTVVLSSGAVGTVTAATATSLTVTLSTRPTVLGNLTAVVTTNSLTSGAAVQVATVIPVVTNNTANRAASATALVITGVGFDPVAAHNTVVFNNGAVGTVTTATATSLTVTFSTKPTMAGVLTAVVTTDSQSSGAPIQVATIIPALISSTASLSITANTIIISGFGFDTTAGNNTVTFNNGAVGTVTAATATSLTVTFSTKPTATGSLTAFVTTDSLSSGTAVQVATVV